MTDDHPEAGWVKSDLFASNTPVSNQPKRSAKAVAGTVARWTGVTVLTLGSLGLFGIAGMIDAEQNAQLEALAEDLPSANQRINSAVKMQEDLPTPIAAERMLNRATADAEGVAAAQTQYLVHAGPLSLEGIPVDELQPDGKTYVFTEEERIEMAEKRRAEGIKGLDRQLTQFFAATSVDDEDFNAAGSWLDAVSGLGDQEGVPTYVWTASPVIGFDEYRMAPVTWTLSDADDKVIAWATAEYRIADGRFIDLTIYTAEEG